MPTKIEWTQETWNPVSGCTKVSPGCTNCYISRTPPFRMAGRKFMYQGKEAGVTTGVQLHPERLEQPLRWKKPKRIFVCSLADLFHEDVPDEFIEDVFAVMAVAQQHTFQVLTKRPDRALKWFQGDILSTRQELVQASAWSMKIALFDNADSRFHDADTCVLRGLGRKCRYCDVYFKIRRPWPGWPLPNVWIGVSVENQYWADRRIPILAQIPAAVRFVSAEPLLGPVDLRRWLRRQEYGVAFPVSAYGEARVYNPVVPVLHWVIAGGESGPRARPAHVEWIESIVEQCRAASVPCFVKQDSGSKPGQQGRIPDDIWVKELPDAIQRP